jgi:hypothetical protein
MPVTAPPTITALPAAPDPNDRATFNARAYPWAAAQAVLATEIAAAADNMYDNALIAETSATDAEYSATAAVASANFKGAWSGLAGALNVPASVSHGGAVYMLGANVADVTAHTPGVSASWLVLSPIRRLSIFETAAATSAPVSGLELMENANIKRGRQHRRRQLRGRLVCRRCSWRIWQRLYLAGWHHLDGAGHAFIGSLAGSLWQWRICGVRS